MGNFQLVTFYRIVLGLKVSHFNSIFKVRLPVFTQSLHYLQILFFHFCHLFNSFIHFVILTSTFINCRPIDSFFDFITKFIIGSLSTIFHTFIHSSPAFCISSSAQAASGFCIHSAVFSEIPFLVQNYDNTCLNFSFCSEFIKNM